MFGLNGPADVVDEWNKGTILQSDWTRIFHAPFTTRESHILPAEGTRVSCDSIYSGKKIAVFHGVHPPHWGQSLSHTSQCLWLGVSVISHYTRSACATRGQPPARVAGHSALAAVLEQLLQIFHAVKRSEVFPQNDRCRKVKRQPAENDRE